MQDETATAFDGTEYPFADERSLRVSLRVPLRTPVAVRERDDDGEGVEARVVSNDPSFSRAIPCTTEEGVGVEAGAGGRA